MTKYRIAWVLLCAAVIACLGAALTVMARQPGIAPDALATVCWSAALLATGRRRRGLLSQGVEVAS
jgi:hypothetical protein